MDNNWSIKHLHRIIMTSRTYRQSSRVTNELHANDPENQLLSRMPLRRMDAEALRDSLLFISRRLDTTGGGRPDPVSVDRNGLVSVKPGNDGRWRRSVYLQYRRTEIPSMMDTFDYPEMGPNCFTRTTSTVSPQALMLMNNAHVKSLADHMAQRLLAEASDEDAESLVALVYANALSRRPKDSEMAVSMKTLEALYDEWPDDQTAALASYCHTILNSAAFVYVD